MNTPERILGQTRDLPRRLQTLKHLATEWTSQEGLRRGDVVITDLPSLVRHNYTNYEEILEAHKPPEGASEHDAMCWAIEHERLRHDVKHQATQLAERMLTEAYGDKWQWPEPSASWSKTNP